MPKQMCKFGTDELKKAADDAIAELAKEIEEEER